MAHSNKLFCSARMLLCLFVSCLMLASIPAVAAEDPIKVHIFLNSHMDLGWIYTMEHYYTGTGGQDGGCVRCIFNNVYDSLDKGTAERKYMIAEVAFFNRWWKEQSEERKQKVHEYVKAGKIEFVSGGWGTNDEATAYYDDIIDQFVIGHRWLKREFNVDPNSGWQIDPFGHSATHAAIMAQAGYDGLFFGRIDYQDWDKRRQDRSLEFNWRASNPHNESILGRVLHVHYSDTKPMVNDNYWCRSIFCNGNLDGNRQNQVTEWIRNQAKTVRTKNIAMLVGDDFHLWQESEKDFKGIEAMIQYYKDHPDLGIEVKFSSLSVYLKETEDAMIADNSILSNLPEKHGDFFPYIENEWTSWTGYFTSKSMWKHRVRQFSEYYNAAKVLLSKYLLRNNQDILKNDKETQGKIDHALDRLEDALAVCQHHDAVSGTNKEGVRKDYERMLNEGRTAIDGELRPLLSRYARTVTGEDLKYTEPLRMELRQEDPKIKEIFEGEKKVVMTVFNPGQKDTHLLKIRVPNDRYKVIDENNNYLITDVICNSDDAQSDCFIYFKDVLPAYSLKSYIISPAKVSKKIVPQDIKTNVKLEFGDEISFQVNSDLANFEYKICPDIDHHSLGDNFQGGECIEDSFNLDYKYYESEPSHGGTRVASGAYIFNPRVQAKKRLGEIKSGRVFRGRLLTVVQIFRDDVRTDIKLVHHQLEQGFEIESNLGAISNPGSGKEIVMNLKSKTIQNNDMEFYTDSNGYYMIHRQKDIKEDFESHNNQPIAGNYYPITSAISIPDQMNKKRMTINTDRAQGASCLDLGEFEIMLHRLTSQDDWKGLGETLNEQEDFGWGMLRVTTRHFVSYSSVDNTIPNRQRRIQYQLDRAPQFWLANTQVDEFLKNRQAEQTLDLPDGVKLYVRSYNYNEYVVRFNNLDEIKTKKIDLYDLSSKACKLFNGLTGRNDLKIQSVTELSIFTHKNRSEVHRNRVDPNTKEVTHNDGESYSTIELVPMEIRTFNIVVSA